MNKRLENSATTRKSVRTRTLFKLLPLLAVVLFVTSWSKYDGGNNETINGKRAGSISYAKVYVGKNVGDASFSNPLTLVGDGKVTYTSDNTDVATVDSDGNVTIIAAGKATITATVEDDTDGFTYAADANTGVYTVVVAPEDCIPGIFSVSKDKKVYFSKGNLQCNVKPKAGEPLWRFAEHQYDKCFANAANFGYNFDSYKGKYIDLFGWGTWLNSTDVESPTSTSEDPELFIWKGTSAIGSVWETLSGGTDENAEWYYLLKCRESAVNKWAKVR